MPFFQKIFGTSQDYHKSAVKFSKIFWPLPPLKIFLNPYTPPKIFGQAHVWLQLFDFMNLKILLAYFYGGATFLRITFEWTIFLLLCVLPELIPLNVDPVVWWSRCLMPVVDWLRIKLVTTSNSLASTLPSPFKSNIWIKEKRIKKKLL